MEELRGDNRPAASLKQSKNGILYVVQIIKKPLLPRVFQCHIHQHTKALRLWLCWLNALSSLSYPSLSPLSPL